MSALTDLFTAMANKIRSKTGTATTYTPTQMASDGIDDVYAAGIADATTSITPSNSSPVSMSANTGYKPTTNGYAIASNPSSITPLNSSPSVISSGIIYRGNGNGYAIESYTKITPSDAFPVTLTQNQPVIPSTSGYAIASNPSSITPSNSSPVSLSSGSIYKMGSSGKAVASVTSATPSDTSPASVASGDIIKPSAAGYLVKTVSNIGLQPSKIYTSDSLGTSGTTTISVTQKPRYAFCSFVTTNNSNYFYMWIIDFTKSKSWKIARSGSTTITSTDDTSGLSTMFPTVSSSSVVFQNNYVNATKRTFIALYY